MIQAYGKKSWPLRNCLFHRDLVFCKSNKRQWLTCLAYGDSKMAKNKIKLADNKIKPTTASVEHFLNGITPEQKREDSFVLLEMMKKASKEKPVLWNNSFIGFG